MTVHMSARLAWHIDGWNGHICNNPVCEHILRRAVLLPQSGDRRTARPEGNNG